MSTQDTPAIPGLTSAVVICAYTERRWDDLRESVGSLETQTHRPDRVVLVIDHNRDLAARARGFFGAPVEVVENRRRRGLSGARNTALDVLAESGGMAGASGATGGLPDVVAFLDDDAAARPAWLELLLAGFDDPDVVAVGGAAAPRWPGEPPVAPAVLPAELWWVVGCSFTGQTPPAGGANTAGPVEVRNLMGCAMAFRRDALVATGGFGEDMGRVGTIPLGCEETELCLRLRRLVPGARIVLDVDAVVDHHVSDDRVGWNYLLRRCHAEGISKAVVARRCGTEQGLAAERTYARHVLPAALRREIVVAGRALRAHDREGLRHGLTAAAAVPAALAAAGAGYLRGRLARVAAPADPDAGRGPGLTVPGAGDLRPAS